MANRKHSSSADIFFFSFPLSLRLFLFVSHLLCTCFCSDEESFGPTYLIDCGATENTSVGGNHWQTDINSSYLSLSSLSPLSSSSHQIIASTPTLEGFLSTATFFTSLATYTFPVLPNTLLFIRLYFYPFNFEVFDPAFATFSVTVDGLALFSNLNVLEKVASNNLATNGTSDYLLKEYLIPANPSRLVTISFSPSTEPGNAYAFVNAIEVISAPEKLMNKTMFTDSHVLNIAYRVNVGGGLILAETDEFRRNWQANESFLWSAIGTKSISVPPPNIDFASDEKFFAPTEVYSTAIQLSKTGITNNKGGYNISWVFPVEADFLYVVRLHFCEIGGFIQSQRIFNVYVQNQTVISSLDVYAVAKGPGIPIYQDFLVNTSGAARLLIQIEPAPNAGTSNNNAILNGIEIFRIDKLGSTMVAPITSPKQPKVAIIIGTITTAAAVLLCLAAFFLSKYLRRLHRKPNATTLEKHVLTLGGRKSSTSVTSETFVSSSASSTNVNANATTLSICRYFSFAEMRQATRDFDENLLLGVGGFGKVYKGELDDGVILAVKRGNPCSEQGVTEFQTEIEMLSTLRHRHLVSLLGYCEEKNEMILVYEYMHNGSLKSHLYGSNLPPLSWKDRLNICIGAARGLHYLHTGSLNGIIHRDVKTANILLDENLVAKVSDFGLSKTGPPLDHTHVSTVVKGSFGYLDPEYFRRQQLTEKSDVYSFGVVLIEVICARPAICPSLPREQVNIAEWAIRYLRKGQLEQIIDPFLVGSIQKDSLRKFGETIEKCLADQGIDRPTMGDVLWNLEYVLQLQTQNKSSISSQKEHLDDDKDNYDGDDPRLINDTHMWNEDNNGSEDSSASVVFSQIVKPQGR